MEGKELKNLESEEIKKQFKKQSEDCQAFARQIFGIKKESRPTTSDSQ